jgi:hypothetical protein
MKSNLHPHNDLKISRFTQVLLHLNICICFWFPICMVVCFIRGFVETSIVCVQCYSFLT